MECTRIIARVLQKHLTTRAVLTPSGNIRVSISDGDNAISGDLSSVDAGPDPRRRRLLSVAMRKSPYWLRRWERARQGDGQLVLIVGEPGLGKSRLIEEFRARLRESPHTWVEWDCSQLWQNTPLHGVSEWSTGRFGGIDIPAEPRLAELQSTLAQIKMDPDEHVPLIASLFDIPLPRERIPTLAAL